MSAKVLHAARRNAELIGRNGEILLYDWFLSEVEAGRLKSVEWTAETNAISPWDFVIENDDGSKVRVELKSTTGPFERDFHISQAEIEWAAEPTAPQTDLYRLFQLQDASASLKICQDIRNNAVEMISAVAGLGAGIVPDGYTISPSQVWTWSQTIAIAVSEDDDEED